VREQRAYPLLYDWEGLCAEVQCPNCGKEFGFRTKSKKPSWFAPVTPPRLTDMQEDNKTEQGLKHRCEGCQQEYTVFWSDHGLSVNWMGEVQPTGRRIR